MDGLDYSSEAYHGALKVTRITVSEGHEHIYAARFSHSGKYLATTFANGVVRVMDTTTSFSSVGRARLGTGFDDLPSTSVKWRPDIEVASLGESMDIDPNLRGLATVSSAGGLFTFNLDTTPTLAVPTLERDWKVAEQGNDTSTCDYSLDGLHLATAGSDRTVRVYDLHTKKLKESLTRGMDETGHHRQAHTNRIFCLRYVSQHSLISAGWENPLQIWDLRTGCAERSITGPQVSSDSVDVSVPESRIYVANNRNSNQIQVFDYVTCREQVAESQKLSANVGASFLSQVRYDPVAKVLWAVASKPDRLLCIDVVTGALKGSVDTLGHGLLCADASPTVAGRCVVGGFKQNLYVVDIVDTD